MPGEVGIHYSDKWSTVKGTRPVLAPSDAAGLITFTKNSRIDMIAQSLLVGMTRSQLDVPADATANDEIRIISVSPVTLFTIEGRISINNPWASIIADSADFVDINYIADHGLRWKRAPSAREVTKEADVYFLVGKVTLGSQNVYGLIDTGAPETFFLWKHWYEKGHPGRCKDIIFGCYECSPEPCREGKLYILHFGDGSIVRIFKESATAHFGSAVSATISFGLVAEYKCAPDVPVPHASFGLAPQDDPKSSYVPIIEQLLSQKLIESSIFSIYLRHDGTNGRGELLLGGSDPSMYKSPLVYVAVTTEDKFVRVTGFSLGGSAYPVMAVNDDGILDTGAECIFIPMHRYTLPTLIKDLEARSSSKTEQLSTVKTTANAGEPRFDHRAFEA
ncbi:Gastricsin precursor, putative [Perkinsus marinus ATCC 50983]|uniref:Gastricsin, putative n=1 Tax=Perkinsus marinus (strain ATCC 50983 / TXsc) TaxID=423536 RepID=C5LSQ1_PERM5|nr:Gastricsin precursor, putative [Perkinsus marinus ATCC 50983]EER00292.1 Gastricsin precursor, putative [Perkinsus marinus ATCC 50983]|eukprot:XP_002767574.1 Gastricsin precursor, putative [Perkinsus marinus ATCC 50983]